MSDLTSALDRLDALLAQAIRNAESVYGGGTASDPFRGLHIDAGEIERLLMRRPGEPLLAVGETDFPSAPSLDWLRNEAELTPFDLDVILVTLAPDIDLRYERLYAYLQDDVTRKRPTVDLVLNLLCGTVRERGAALDRFGPTAPLVAGRLIRLVPPPDQPTAPLLANAVRLDEQIFRAFLGNTVMDERLAPFCELVGPVVSLDELFVSDEMREALDRLARECKEAANAARVYLRGLPGTGRRHAAEAVAAASGLSLLVADMARAPRDESFANVVALLFREARLREALLFVHSIDALRDDSDDLRFDDLLRALTVHTGAAFFAGSEPWAPQPASSGSEPLGMVELRFDVPGVTQRRAAWEAELVGRGLDIGAATLDELASRFRLTFGQINEAAALAARSSLHHRRNRRRLAADVFVAARAQTGYDLGKLAVKVEPIYGWNDIVIPVDVREQLQEIQSRVAYRDRVMNEWGFDRKLSHGKGVTALFTGPPGTGKTMAAEIIGQDLGLDLYTIDLSGIVSKWIGETEKNLDRIFQAAEHGNAVLCFHEADALFGKRSEVSDAHDRYANIEISYLLQKMETYDGLAVLTTNLAENIDEAFVRRLAYTVHFPFPEAPERRTIWERVWPVETPLGDDIDFDGLAYAFRLSGGNIKNAALAAAFLAADEGTRVEMRHLLQAVRREFEKMGRALSEEELEPFAPPDREVIMDVR